MSLAELSGKMTGGLPFDLGMVAEDACTLISSQLEHAGFVVIIEAASVADGFCQEQTVSFP